MALLSRLLTVALLALCVACGRNDAGRKVLTVTIPPQQWLLQQIAGDRYEVQSLLSSGSNPETFEPSMQQLMALENSAAYFRIGMPGFEEATLAKVRENFPALTIVDTSTGIQPLTGTHHSHEGHEHHADEADPHVWTSLRNARIMAANMRDHLIALDPEGKETYTANFKRLDDRLKALDDSIAWALAPQAGTSFLVWHPSLGYFARDYGLKQLSMEQEGKEASVGMMRAHIDRAGDSRPCVFFLQQEYDSRSATSLASEIGVPTATIAVMQPDIAAQARAITKAINGR